MLAKWLENAVSMVKASPTLPIPAVLPKKMHTFYGGAHLFKPTTLSRMAEVGQRGLDHFWPTPQALGNWYEYVFCMQGRGGTSEGRIRPVLAPFSNEDLTKIHECLRKSLSQQFIEDYRIDFEDGYGVHALETELAQAERCARVLADIVRSATDRQQLPEMGIRLKPFSGTHREHSVRVFDRFFEVLHSEVACDALPRFWITLPKIREANEAVHFQHMVSDLEHSLGVAPNTFGIELMFETLESVRALGQADFLANWMPDLSRGGEPGVCQRPSALVLGTYDTCAEWGILAMSQGHRHPIMDHVRLQALSWGNQIGAHVVDSITRAVPQLSDAQPFDESSPLVVHGQNVVHSLAMGVSAGWDIHPLHVLARHAVRLATVSHGLGDAITRLKQFLQAQTHASRVGAAFDDLATVRGLVSQIQHAIQLGLITEAQIVEQGVHWPAPLAHG